MVRLSGPQAVAIAAAMFQQAGGRGRAREGVEDTAVRRNGGLRRGDGGTLAARSTPTAAVRSSECNSATASSSRDNDISNAGDASGAGDVSCAGVAWESHRALYGHVVDEAGQVMDEVRGGGREGESEGGRERVKGGREEGSCEVHVAHAWRPCWTHAWVAPIGCMGGLTDG